MYALKLFAKIIKLVKTPLANMKVKQACES